MILRNTVIATSIARLTTTDQALHCENSLIIPIALFFLLQVGHNFTVTNLDNLVRAIGKELVKTIDEVHIKPHFFIGHSYVTRCLVGNMHIVLLLHQPTDGTAHRDDIIVGMGREHHHPFGIGFGTLRTSRVINIRFTSGPTGNRML